jgi:hypothetical protein
LVRGFFMPFFLHETDTHHPAAVSSALRVALSCLSGWQVFDQAGEAESFFERLWFSIRKNGFFCSFFLQE